MNLQLNSEIAKQFKNSSQKIRVLTEFWVKQNIFCPNCGSKLSKFKNNKPVADFLCEKCSEEFELKSKNSKSPGNKIVDGAYHTMIERINSENNPNFFFLTYDKSTLIVNNFMIIPKFYFLPKIIEKRKPLSANARRSGWIGCNILLNEIPESGRIYFVKNSIIIDKSTVIGNWQKTIFLDKKDQNAKGWILDVMICIDKIRKNEFSLEDIYKFEPYLKAKHPNNNFIKDKIRQQLQLLRDKGIIEFIGRGKYKKIN